VPQGIRQLAAQGVTACALTDGDELWCWGASPDGQVGNGTQALSGQWATPVGL
jgi:alpha-tubulin suppressor-like RCC1 family protein